MKLLFVTQVVDRGDAVLGAYHEWLRALAPAFERIEVICLYEGEHSLPENVRVHSLGKEAYRGGPSGIRKLMYSSRFLRLVWKLRNDYDAAFVHMNQEYILLAGVLWKLWGKRIYMWRNHYAGSWRTDIAAAFCTAIFCTSVHSYTSKYRRTKLMPVGVDLDRFTATSAVERVPGSLLFLARMSPSKRPDIFIDALGLLLGKGVSFVASIYGSPAPGDEAFYESLKARVERLGLHGRVRFHPAVPNEKAPAVFSTHEVFVNCSPSGMFDKTLFEAAASGCVVLATSDDFARLVGEESRFGDAEALAERLGQFLMLPPDERRSRADAQRAVVGTQSLATLVARLREELA